MWSSGRLVESRPGYVWVPDRWDHFRMAGASIAGITKRGTIHAPWL
ncbi:MAG: hypothetical protein ACOYNL_00295 [Rickettsiales bacterium]